MTQSAYIHIPFCKSKCNYCSFVSYTGSDCERRKKYVDTLLLEIENYYKDEPLKTLYIGGGTPSLLSVEDLKRILYCFNYDPSAEITIEINPETVDLDYLTALKNTGFNRVSIGVQSFDNSILRSIGRIHNSQKALQTIIEAQKAGFKNISTDFIYGLPRQTLDKFIKDLNTAIELGVEHISLYGLKIEEGCKFYKTMPENIADDDLQADMYLAAIDALEKAGYKHYEISNFAKNGFESRHNLNYWNDGEYYGFGAAAHGYIGGVRYSNYTDLKEYYKNYDSKEFLEALNTQERLEECIFLGFRKGEGININKLNERFGIDFEAFYKNILDKYTATNHLIKTPTGYRLSNEGFLISNIILAEFIDC